MHCGHCDGCPSALQLSALWFLEWPSVRGSITEWSPEWKKGVSRCLSISYSLYPKHARGMHAHRHTHGHHSIFYPFKQSTSMLSRTMRANKYLRLSKQAFPSALALCIFNDATFWFLFSGKRNLQRHVCLDIWSFATLSSKDYGPVPRWPLALSTPPFRLHVPAERSLHSGPFQTK